MNLRKEGYPAVLDSSQIQKVFGVSRWTLRNWLKERRMAGLEWLQAPNGRLAVTRSSLQDYLDRQVSEMTKVLA